MEITQYTRKIRFGHVTLILAFIAAAITYYQTLPIEGMATATATLAVFVWTLIATWVSVEFYKGELVNEKEELKKWNEDWRATVVDFRNENEELKDENEELRDTIKELTRENYELKEKLGGGEADAEAIEE